MTKQRYTNGNPDDRSNKQIDYTARKELMEELPKSKSIDVWTAEQISEPINWKSEKLRQHEQYLERSKTSEFQDKLKQYTNSPEVKERRKEYKKEYCQNPEVKEHIKEYKKEYHISPETQNRLHNNPEVKRRLRAIDRKYKQTHREEINASSKKYYQEHPDKAAQHQRNYNRLYKEYYSKGTTKTKELLKDYIEAKKRTGGFSHQEPEDLIRGEQDLESLV